MTPEREKYLAKCGKKEMWLREEIKSYKREIKCCKSELSKGYDYEFWLGSLRFRKMWLQLHHHELNRLKGMYRVVVPYVVYDKSSNLEDWYCSNCNMGVSVFERYCSNCGRRILWDKVK